MAGIVIFYWIGFFINALYSKRLINYSIVAQCKDFIPLIFLLSIPAALIFGLGVVLQVRSFLLLVIQMIVYILVVGGISILFKLAGFLEILEILRNKITVSNMVKTFKSTDIDK